VHTAQRDLPRPRLDNSKAISVPALFCALNIKSAAIDEEAIFVVQVLVIGSPLPHSEVVNVQRSCKMDNQSRSLIVAEFLDIGAE
jgi:hypothetical protein